MVSSAYILFGIALLSIILGFVALLSQKVYLDATTKQPTEVQIPFLGKIKSNYPALVFAFLGAALAFYAFQKSFPLPPPPLEDWTLTGSFKPPEGKTIRWREGTLALLPLGPVTADVQPDTGRFQIHVKAPKGTPVENVLEAVDYSYLNWDWRIDLAKEWNALRNKDSRMKHELFLNPVPPTDTYPP